MDDSICKNNIAIVLSAGRGSRMCSDIPKQYMDLCGRPAIAWSLKAFQEFEPVGTVILVTAEEDIDYCRNEIIDKYRFDKVKKIVPGGAERFLSVWEGLKAALELMEAEKLQAGPGSAAHTVPGSAAHAVPGSAAHTVPGSAAPAAPADSRNPEREDPIVFIHDGARPFVDRPILERTLKSAEECHACVAAMPVKDTIKIADEEGFAARTPARRLVWQVQTPQVFSFSLVYKAYRRLIEAGIANVTDDAMVVERMTATRVKLVEGSYRNLKLTTPEDIAVAEAVAGRLKENI